MKKIVLISLALFLGWCSLQTPPIPNVVDQTTPPSFSDYISGFIQNQTVSIDPTWWLYTKYNPGAMSRIRHFSGVAESITAHQETWLGQWGSGEAILCDSFDAVLDNPSQKCNCEQDTPPETHKCKIGYVATGTTNTFISGPLNDDLSEAGTQTLNSWDILQIQQAQQAESGIAYRLYIEDKSAVWYFAPRWTWYDLRLMDIVECCSA